MDTVYFFMAGIFPNALYIVTDLIHLQRKTDVPKWYDAITYIFIAMLGLMMAFISLFRVEKFLQLNYGNGKTL